MNRPEDLNSVKRSADQYLTDLGRELGRAESFPSKETAMNRSEDLKRLALELSELLPVKNQAYGSAFELCAPFLRLLYPDGVSPAQYTDLMLLARVFDKCMRIATCKDAFGESPWKDIAGYAILGCSLDEEIKP